MKDFDWSSLKYTKDEVDYLKNRYDGDTPPSRTAADWLNLLTKSHQTYTKVKSTFEDLGIDADKIINAENAAKVLSNPVVAKSVYEKIEKEYGIPVSYSEDFANKNRKTLEEWARFVEEREE